MAISSKKKTTNVYNPSNQEFDNQNITQIHHKPSQSLSLKIKLDHMISLEPMSDNQARFFDMYKRGGYLIALLGSAGTGKTYAAIAKGIEEVLDKSNPYKEVVIVRSIVPLRDIGFLPGDLDQKAEIYELPYREICAALFKRPDAYDRLKEQGHIRFLTTTAIRGVSIDDAIIIYDEVQNGNFRELDSVLTRVSHRSKLILCGDIKQNDLHKSKNDVSGLNDFLKILRTMKEYEEIIFTPDDICRSDLVKNYIIAKEKLNL